MFLPSLFILHLTYNQVVGSLENIRECSLKDQVFCDNLQELSTFIKKIHAYGGRHNNQTGKPSPGLYPGRETPKGLTV
jgi:hypothetical protein